MLNISISFWNLFNFSSTNRLLNISYQQAAKSLGDDEKKRWIPIAGSKSSNGRGSVAIEGEMSTGSARLV